MALSAPLVLSTWPPTPLPPQLHHHYWDSTITTTTVGALCQMPDQVAHLVGVQVAKQTHKICHVVKVNISVYGILMTPHKSVLILISVYFYKQFMSS